MKFCRVFWFACIALLAASRAIADPGRNGLFARFDLTDSNSCAEWQAGFADYPAGQETFYRLTAQCVSDATNLNRGFFLSGDNHSDDLFMFIKHPISGLKPSRAYEVEASIQFLSRAPTNCIGAGGDPGASVYVKFGAATVEPAPMVQSNGIVKMNVDIGNQSNSGSNAMVIGDITTTNANCFNAEYELKELGTAEPLAVLSDENGTLWIFVGTDSGFEGRTSLFYTRVRVHLHPQRTDENED